MTLPLISVVLPVRYVNEPWLRKSIESVLQQDYPNKELIVVNDEATQDIDPLIREYGIVKYIKNDRNRKLPYSLNRGFEAADGEFHTWTSADNYMLPKMLSTLAQHLLHVPEAAIVLGNSISVDKRGCESFLARDAISANMSRVLIADRHTNIPSRFTYFSTLGACFLYRSSVFRQLGGYDEALHGAEDYDFWIRAARKFCVQRLSKTIEPLYAYRTHDSSMSASVKGCFTRMRLAILCRELRCQPWNMWLYFACFICIRRWCCDGLNRLVRSFREPDRSES